MDTVERADRGDRLTWSLLVLAGVVALGVSAVRLKDEIVYNGSPSMPVGFYRRANEPVVRDAIVTVRGADVAPAYSRLREFTGDRDRLIKRVVGVSGDVVCADNETVSLNNAVVAHRRIRDRVGRALPRWERCKTLSSDEVFLLGETEDSFDGRYFGPVERSKIEGVWHPLLVTEEHHH